MAGGQLSLLAPVPDHCWDLIGPGHRIRLKQTASSVSVSILIYNFIGPFEFRPWEIRIMLTGESQL